MAGFNIGTIDVERAAEVILHFKPKHIEFGVIDDKDIGASLLDVDTHGVGRGAVNGVDHVDDKGIADAVIVETAVAMGEHGQGGESAERVTMETGKVEATVIDEGEVGLKTVSGKVIVGHDLARGKGLKIFIIDDDVGAHPGRYGIGDVDGAEFIERGGAMKGLGNLVVRELGQMERRGRM